MDTNTELEMNTDLDMNTELDTNIELEMNTDLDMNADLDTNTEVSSAVSTNSESEEIVGWIDLLSDSEYDELEESILELMEEYSWGQISKMSDPKFANILCDDITAYFFTEWNETGICKNTDDDYIELQNFVNKTYDKYILFYSNLPARQRDINDFQPEPIEIINDKLERLNNIPQPKQRTREWYEKRNQMITASNIYKALGSESQRNSLIYEKCKQSLYENCSGSVNTSTSMHWGVKYEPITSFIYQDMYSTTLADYGCITHESYPFIGASPDGIVVNPESDRYGHMVEIKNIVNRDITGIPKEDYWIQMQVQLEVCGLNYCDFVETRIKEYDNSEQYYTDEEHTYKGVVLYFVRKMLVTDALPDVGVDISNDMNAPHYVYMPINIPISQTNNWISEQRHIYREDYVLYRTDYWYLDYISCVIVERNKEWFKSVVPIFENIWNTIEKERLTGYDHRATIKKQKPVIISEEDSSTGTRNIPICNAVNNICLIKLDAEGNSI